MMKLSMFFENKDQMQLVLNKIKESPINFGLRFELMDEPRALKRAIRLLQEVNDEFDIEFKQFHDLETLEYGFSYDEKSISKEQKIFVNGAIRSLAWLFGSKRTFKKKGEQKFIRLSCEGHKSFSSVTYDGFHKKEWSTFLDESRLYEMLNGELDKNEDVTKLLKDFVLVLTREPKKESEDKVELQEAV